MSGPHLYTRYGKYQMNGIATPGPTPPSQPAPTPQPAPGTPPPTPVVFAQSYEQ